MPPVCSRVMCHGTYSGNSNAVNGWKDGQTDTYAELEQITCQACSGCTTSSTGMSHEVCLTLCRANSSVPTWDQCPQQSSCIMLTLCYNHPRLPGLSGYLDEGNRALVRTRGESNKYSLF